MPEISWDSHASRIQDRIDALAAITDEKGVITRTFLSEATVRANQVVGGWMQGSRDGDHRRSGG